MGVEIERKYLVKNEQWKTYSDAGKQYVQGYLVGSKQASVRVRIEGDKAFLNIKSATLGVRRQEYEYPLPVSEAKEILNTLCEQPLIEKTRYHVTNGTDIWEVDVFAGQNAGLVVAEIELDSEDTEVKLPMWVGAEVSDDPRYYNVSLVKHPYSEW